MDTQAFRRSLHHSDRYNRRGFDSPTKRAQALEEAYQSDLISSIRDNDFCLLYTSPSPRDVSTSRMPLPQLFQLPNKNQKLGLT